MLLFTSSFVKLYSQNLKSDLAKVNAVYANSKKYAMDCDYLYFEDQSKKTPYTTVKGQIKKCNDINYVKQGDTETINTSDYSVRVNNDSKTITLLPKKNYKTPSSPIAVNIDSLAKFYKKVDFKKISNDINSYSFDMSETSEYQKFELQFDKNNYQIKRLIFYFTNLDISDDEIEKKTNPKIEIVYSKFSNTPNLQEKDINYERFLIKKGKTYELKPEFLKYKLYSYTL